jgi:collagenase-like PrtC family protease
MGVRRFRLSPHSCDMVKAATTFRAVLDKRIEVQEAEAHLQTLALHAPFSNGFFYGKPGFSRYRPVRH